jgi:hypothetical protein
MTLDVLRLLARRVEGTPVVLVVTYRDDEAAANAELARLLGDLTSRPAVRRLSLQPLSEAAVRELAEPAGVDAARLSRVTGGNPFLVVEAIAAGDRQPASVRDATLGRTGRLGSAAHGNRPDVLRSGSRGHDDLFRSCLHTSWDIPSRITVIPERAAGGPTGLWSRETAQSGQGEIVKVLLVCRLARVPMRETAISR